ncbi:MAG: vWA domain-containing protein [Methyloligellaceae bacterium]
MKSTFIKKLMRDKRGHVGVMFGMCLLPVLSAVGMSIDYSSAISAKSKIQVALDAAALAAGRELQTTGSEAAATAAAQKHFSSTLNSKITATVSVDSIDSQTGKINLSGTASVPTTIMSIIGVDNITVSSTTQAELAIGGAGEKDVEISMMLDVTGSMGGSKLSDMKLAAKDLIQIVLQGNGISTLKARVALVPFSEAVNVGSYMSSVGKSVSSKKKFTYKNGKKYTWNRSSNCVSERTGTNAFTDAAPSGSDLVGRVYSSNGSCKPSSKIIPLTDDQTLLENTIDGFSASGYTAGHLGTAWAWYMLSPNWKNVWPSSSEPADYDPEETMKIAILMTDGEYNTQYSGHIQTRYQKYASNSPNGSSDTQADKLCEKMKEAGVTVYTIGFDLNSSSAKNTLKGCATSDDHYFLADDGEKLRATFREIAFQIAQLRLSK